MLQKIQEMYTVLILVVLYISNVSRYGTADREEDLFERR